MTRNYGTFTKAFLVSFVLQFFIYIAYLVSGIFSSAILWFYWPVLIAIEMLQHSAGWQGWRGLGFVLALGPLVGALVYSVGIAFGVHCFHQRNGRGRLAA